MAFSPDGFPLIFSFYIRNTIKNIIKNPPPSPLQKEKEKRKRKGTH